MNLVPLRLITLSSLVMISKGTYLTKQDHTDMNLNHISNRFTDLLNSLVKVNVERVDALKTLLKLYDVNVAKEALRTVEEREYSGSRSGERLYDDEYPEIVNKYPVAGTKKLTCICQKADSENYNVFTVSDILQRVENRERALIEDHLRFHKEKLLNKADRDNYQTVDKKQPIKKRNSPPANLGFSRNKVKSPSIKTKNRKEKKTTMSRKCISPRRGYMYCRRSCKRAFKTACGYSDCSNRLYRYFKKECAYECDRRFQGRDEDED